MKIYIDNEIENFRKIVMIQNSENMGLEDDLNTIIDALKACSYTEDCIKDAFLNKLMEWELVEPFDETLN